MCSGDIVAVTRDQKTKIARHRGAPQPSRQMFYDKSSASTHSSKEIAGFLKKMKNNNYDDTKIGRGVWQKFSRGKTRVRTILSGL